MTYPQAYAHTPQEQVPQTTPPTIHAVTVDKAVIAFMQKWLPTYLTEAERREGKPTRWLPRPVVWTTVYEEDDEDFFSDARMPTGIVTASTASDWERDGENNWAVTYRTAISIVCRGRSMVEARLQAAIYAATVTALLLDMPSLGGLCNGVEVINERPRPIVDPSNRSRTMAAGMGEYDLWIPDVRRGFSGPWKATDNPPSDPDAAWPVRPRVASYGIDVEGETP